jgi:hypothetical protein
MAAWRVFAILVVTLAAARASRGQTHSLVEAPVAGKFFQVQVQMKLAGEMRLRQEGKTITLKQTATADHDFLERVLDVGPNGLARKSALFFKKAQAVVTVSNHTAEKTLSPEHRLLVAQRVKDQGLCYCPAGALTREEIEVSDHFDTLCLPGLLPGKAVAVGDTWKVANAVVQALCNFEGLTAQDLVCKLTGVKNNIARVTVTGKVAGIDTGALVKLTVTAAYQFDLKARRLTSLEWTQKEERDQGPASPASTNEVTTTLKRTAAEPANELSGLALVSVPDGFDVPLPLTQVYYLDKKNRFDLMHSREWQMVGLTDAHMIMRLMDRGDFVAQLTIAPWPRADAGKHLAPEEVEEILGSAPGWEQDQVIQAGEVKSDEKGRWVYRISAAGRLDGLKIIQNLYLVASPRGEQVVLTFTMTESQAQKIGTRDLTLVGSLDFPNGRKEADRGKKP